MKYFKNGLKRLIVIGMNDYVIEALKYCKAHDVEIVIISSPRFVDLEYVSSNEYSSNLCHAIVEEIGGEVKIWDKLLVSELEQLADGDSAVFSFDSPFIIKQDVISMFGGAVFNEHGARLPQDKGGGGFTWRILENDRHGQVVFHEVIPEVDAGRILFKQPFVFSSHCRKPLDFMQQQAGETINALPTFLDMLRKNAEFNLKPQDDIFSSYWPRISTSDQAFIDWSWSTEQIKNFVLAFSTPYEGAKSYVDGNLIHILDCFVDSRAGQHHPFKHGIVFRVSNGDLYVAVQDGSLVITEYDNKSGKPILPGDRIYTPLNVLENTMSQRVRYGPDGIITGD